VNAEPRNPALEARIVENPDDDATYSVYGDWLETRGHPRGALITAQAAGNAEVEAAILAEHRELLGPPLDLDPQPTITWHLGFWRRLQVGYWGWSPKPAEDRDVATLLAHPSARFVRELTVAGSLTPAVFQILATAHATVTLLDVRVGDGVDDRCLEALASCTRLEQLHLFSCDDVTARGAQVLRAMRALRSLDLRNCPLDDRIAGCLADLPHFERVMFNAVSREFSARGMAALARAPLVSLELGGEHVGDAHVAELAHHATLANLEIGRAPLSTAGAASLATLPDLRRLYVCSSSLGDAGVHELASLPLRSLHLGHCKTLTDAACASIARIATLRFLDLSSNAIGSAGLRALHPLGELEQLVLAFLGVDDAAVADICASFPKLRALSLGFSREITDAAIDALVRLDALESLDLAGSQVTARGIDRLAQMPNLTALGLEDCSRDAIERAKANERWYVNTRDLLDHYDSLADYA